MKIVLAVLLSICVVLSLCPFVQADTGTYNILDYVVKLTPRQDGRVEMEYQQIWQVTGGNIPWVTVGLASRDFKIVRNSEQGNALSVTNSSQGSWSGVRIQLDKNYKQGQVFKVGFKIVQNGLIYSDGDRAKLDFVPGWYDRATTGRLRVEMSFFSELNDVTASPKPISTDGRTMVWQWKNVGRGQQTRIKVSFAKTLFAGNITTSRPSNNASHDKIITVIAIVALVLFVLGIMWCFNAVQAPRRRGYGTGGFIFFPGHSDSGSDFGGGCVSCACACVSCACACACAGGGAAGCDRKINFRCILCVDCAKKDDCSVWNLKTTA
jgi:hypothetical protein